VVAVVEEQVQGPVVARRLDHRAKPRGAALVARFHRHASQAPEHRGHRGRLDKKRLTFVNFVRIDVVVNLVFSGKRERSLWPEAHAWARLRVDRPATPRAAAADVGPPHRQTGLQRFSGVHGLCQPLPRQVAGVRRRKEAPRMP
jgi:hypothetical protein